MDQDVWNLTIDVKEAINGDNDSSVSMFLRSLLMSIDTGEDLFDSNFDVSDIKIVLPDITL